MEKRKLVLRTVLSTVMTALGLAVPASAQEDVPEIERDTVLLKPLQFTVNGTVVTDENENQRLWNELMKYKLWGTDSVIFNKGQFRIAEPSGYTGSAQGKVYFRNGHHTLGGPIISGSDIEISYPGMGADYDSLLVGPIRAGWLVLPSWYSAQEVNYEGIYCFEKQVYFDQPDRFTNTNGDASTVANRFINNVHKSGGKIYADWDKDYFDADMNTTFPGLPNLNLDGSFADCPSDVPQPEKNLTVPALNLSGISWDPAVDLTAPTEEIKSIDVPPITAEDLAKTPKQVWFDKYVEDIRVSSHTGKVLYIYMPSASHNANEKMGRLTRIFSRDGFNFENSANDMRIQVVYVNKDAEWDDGTQSWKNVDLSTATIVPDSNYAGNLLFYTPSNVEWKPFKASSGDGGDGAHFQGTFITSGSFKIYDHLSIAGQLIAGEWLWFESEFNGEFHYVPFNAAEIKADIFASDKFKENNKWVDMNFYLTDVVQTDVSFDYCFAFFGTDYVNTCVDNEDGTQSCKYDGYMSQTGTFASADDIDLSDDTHAMPLCSKGETGHVIIAKGTRSPTAATMPYIKVVQEGDDAPNHGIEGDEWMVFKIMNLNGASIAGGKFDGGIPVKLIDANNKPPKFLEPEKVKLSVPENSVRAKAGTISAKDEEGDAYVFDIVGGNGSKYFEINSSSGVVKMKSSAEPFDYEEWVTSGTKYYIDVELCDASATTFSLLLCAERRFQVTISDVNETPYFDYESTDNLVFTIAENGSYVNEKVKTADYDTQSADETYTYDEVIAIGGDTDKFDVKSSGLITLKKDVVLDYETKSTYTLELQVRDANKAEDGSLVYPDLHEEMTITIKVTDVDDGPKFDLATYNGNVDENSIATTEVKMDNAIYATTSQVGASITYSLIDETKSFVIDPSTGVISVAEGAVLDYETKSTYEMKVVASDESGVAGQKIQYDTSKVIIKLNDLNEKPIFVEPTTALTFPENAKGYEIGTLTFDDFDTAKKFRDDRFLLIDSTLGFDLDPTTGVITTNRKFDYETEAKTYELNVVIYDASGDKALTASGVITIELTNINEPPFLTETVFTVLESAPVGSELEKPLEADDVDGPDTKFNFFILDGTKEVNSTKEFKLDSKTGVFTVASSLDYETKESYSVKIRVRDEHDGYSDTTVTINVVDVNEAPAVKVDTIYVKENQKVNDPFSTVKTDKDDPDTKNADFRNNVYENTDGSEVVKILSNGDAVLLQTVDYETDSIYTITVRVTDKDDATLTSTKNVVVKVVDVFEQSVVEITRVETEKEIYLKPDSVFVNDPIVNIEWTQDDKLKSSTDTLKKEGCNQVIKSYKDRTKNAAGADTVIICYSTATPIVTVTANGDNVEAENIYTVVEKATKNDTAIYVNDVKNDIKVTVKDTVAKVSKSFTVNLELDTVSVSSKEFKNVTKIAESEVTRKKEPSSGITSTSENGDYTKNTYADTINGLPVTVTYYTDKKGKDVKRSVVTSSGKVEEIAVIEVSYTTKINGKEVTISYYADASTGERVTINTGLYDSESVLSADGADVTGTYKVSYEYTDKNGNTVDVSYYLDEKGKIAKNTEGNIGYNVGYTYVNKYGNSSRKEVFIVLDQKGPVVKIESPSEDEVLTSTFTVVKWTVNGVEQDTLRIQGLENGVNTIIRVFRDKAGNESRDSVHVMVKNVKNINIDVEKPVTLVDRDSVEKYYSDNKPQKDQTYSVTFFNYKKNVETEALVGIKGKAKEGSGEEPYPGFEGGHLGPTLVVEARVPVVNALGGLATLDDIVSTGNMVALEGVDAAKGTKISVDDYVEKYCTTEFQEEYAKSKDLSRMNLYWTTLKVRVWVYSNAGVFTDHYSFDYDLDDPDYVSDAGLLNFNFELKPDENGDVRTKHGRLYGTGAYIFKTEVKMSSKLRCTLPPISEDRAELKKNAVLKSSDDLLKSFGYRRAVDK